MKIPAFIITIIIITIVVLAYKFTDNASENFSHNKNPNGNWIYGYTYENAFSKIDTPGKVHDNVWFWQAAPHDTALGEPTLGKNEGAAPWVINGTTIYQPGDFALHPGPRGERAVLRWIAPKRGLYLAIASFKGADASTSTDAHIIKDGQEVWSEIVTGNVITHSHAFLASIAAKKKIDFQVGPNGSYAFDTTITNIMVIPLL